MVIMTDFILPFINNKDKVKDDEEYEKEESELGLAIGILLSIVLSVFCSAYTLIIIYSTIRRKYITGDFLDDKQINDNLSLMKTVQLVCGYSTAVVYCNLYFWRDTDNINSSNFRRPNFYDEIIVPDYNIKSGLSAYMIAKIILIVISVICHSKSVDFFDYNNDLAEFNLSKDGCKYDNELELNKIKQEKYKIVNILKN